MAELTLLERIQALEEKTVSTGKTPVEIEKRSIVVHLNKLLNTDRGSSRIDPDLGMPNMSDFSADAVNVMMEKMTTSIVTLVSRFEKRLSKVKVMRYPFILHWREHFHGMGMCRFFSRPWLNRAAGLC